MTVQFKHHGPGNCWEKWDKLPDEHLVRLVQEFHCSYRNIAEYFGVSRHTVSRRLARVLAERAGSNGPGGSP